jgi:ribosomal protein S27E
MSDEFQTSMSVPLDSDGFLRRECPTCEHEFKVFIDQEGDEEAEAQDAPPGGYYCPYCAIQAGPDAWFTKAQLDAAKSKLMEEFVDPMLDDFKRSVENSPFVSVNVDKTDETVPDLTETDDMRRVDFACHPGTPVKVADDHTGPVHCMICGQQVGPTD